MAEEKLDEKLNSALNLMRRMPPSSTENSLAGLLELAPDLTDELLTHVDQPLCTTKDTTEKGNNRYFVQCDYNRDGDSYRSPYSNQYFPAMEDGFKPNERLRKLEMLANDLFSVYRKLYFGTAFSSAYFFETEEKDTDGFGACYLIKKDIPEKEVLKKGVWDSIHVFEVVPATENDHFIYKLTTTVMISMILESDTIGTSDLSGLRTQQNEITATINGKPENHLVNMGKMLEQCESRIRNEIQGIYIGKTRTVINGMRGSMAKHQSVFGNIADELKKQNRTVKS